MDFDGWRWLWIVVLSGFLLGEMFTPGTFFFLPFAAGALFAAVVAFLGGPVPVQWGVFVFVAIVTSIAFIPLRRRLDRITPPVGVGAHRILNQEGVVLEAIPSGADGIGMVRIEREQWRAHSDTGLSIPAGSVVRVVEVRGTGVIVQILNEERGS